jgi:hypothetical protein
MKTTREDIRQLILDKLESIVDEEGNSIFGDIFDYPEAKFENYPVAVIMSKGIEGEILDTSRNQRTFKFTIDLYQEQTKAGRTPEEAEKIMGRASDKIIEAFDTDQDLGGEVLMVRIVNAVFDFKVAEGTFNFATFEIDCVSIVENY